MEPKISPGNEVNLESSVSQAEGIPYTFIGDEIAFVNINKNKYYGLDSIGTRIWLAIEKPKIIRVLIEELLVEYDVDRKTCEDHVLELLQRLYEEGLIIIN